MSSIFLTSGPVFSVKNGSGERKAAKINNKLLLENLKKEIRKCENLLFVCSSPDDYKKNDAVANLISKSLSLSGLKFRMYDLIDSRNWLFSKGLINNADLIILLGGDPIEQIEFFNNIELKDKLKKYNNCLMGISAGTINMADYVYCSKDGKIESSLYYRGLGITNINIEPHFNIEDTQRINNVLLPDSNERPFVALPDESFIMLKNNTIKLYGEAYYFNEGQYKKIDEDLENLYNRREK